MVQLVLPSFNPQKFLCLNGMVFFNSIDWFIFFPALSVSVSRPGSPEDRQMLTKAHAMGHALVAYRGSS